jgi:hypothetical protein
MRHGALLIVALLASGATTLPKAGTQFHSLPAGQGRAQVEAACYRCHSADLIAQQRLTEKQWTAAIEKMMRWGAVVKDDDKPKMIAYLVKNFSPGNTTFKPIRTRPIGK